MNSFGKVLVVFVTASSLGFLAFSMSLVAGGPNWKADAESDELVTSFVFTTEPGEVPKYSAKNRRTEEAVNSSTLLPEVVVAARKKQVELSKAEETKLSAEIARLKPMLEEFKAFIPPDQAGLMARATTMDKILTQLRDAIQAASQEFTTKSVAIQEIYKTAQERREEGFRLKNQLELMRTDLFVAQAQQKVLEDELVRVEENLKRLQRREVQLKKQVEPYEGK